jgi:acid phosphatase (class A)
MRKLACSLLFLCGLVLLEGCAAPTRVTAPVSAPAAPPVTAAEVGEVRPGFLKGYLQPAELPDSLALLPAPPADGSVAQAADDASFHELTKLLGTPRGALAVSDADLRFPQAAGIFSCALGVQISEQETPHLVMLMRRTMSDAGLATYKAKTRYQRTRPFVRFKVPSCSPGDEAYLVKDGSYPSGHSAVGWAWALSLAQIAPERADAILQRGRAFGQSRGICGVHWASDVTAGRMIGSATLAREQSNAVFQMQLAAARAEVARQRSLNAVPATDCAAEAAAIASTSSLAP